MMSPAEIFLCRVLRGEPAPWAFADDDATCAAFMDTCVRHGVHVLIQPAAQAHHWPVSLRRQLDGSAIAAAMWEHAHRELLAEAGHMLRSAGIEALVFKGTALAYTAYAQAHLRSRADTDLLVRPRDRFDAAQVLQGLGFAVGGSLACNYLSYESSFAQAHATGEHLIDLHWRIHFSLYQSRTMSYPLLRGGAHAVAALGGLFAPSPLHAVLLCCLHRANDLLIPQWNESGATYGSDRLLWLYDLALLLAPLGRQDQEHLAALATELGLGALCAEPIALAAQHLQARFPSDLLADMQAQAPDAFQRYHRMPPWAQRWADLRTLPVSQQLRYVHEHLLPPPEYLRGRFPQQPQDSVARLRLRRLAQGLPRLRRRVA